jgi:hypothetical protein
MPLSRGFMSGFNYCFQVGDCRPGGGQAWSWVTGGLTALAVGGRAFVCIFFANRSLSARGDKGPATPSKDENRNALGAPPNLSSSPK